MFFFLVPLEEEEGVPPRPSPPLLLLLLLSPSGVLLLLGVVLVVETNADDVDDSVPPPVPPRPLLRGVLFVVFDDFDGFLLRPPRPAAPPRPRPVLRLRGFELLADYVPLLPTTNPPTPPLRVVLVSVVFVDGFVPPPRSPPSPRRVIVAPDGADCFCCFPAPRTFFVVFKYGFDLRFSVGSIFTATIAAVGTDCSADTDADDTSADEEGRDGEDPETKGTILLLLSPGGEGSLLRFPNVGGLSSTLLILSSTITSVVGVVGVVAVLFLEKSGTDRGCGIDSSERLLQRPS